MPLVSLHVDDVHAIHIALFRNDTSMTQRFQDNYLGGPGTDVNHGSVVIDHVASYGTGVKDMIARLDKHGANSLRRQANAGDLLSPFIDAPNGMRVELNFDEAEAKADGIRPAMTAQDAVAETV